MRQGDDMSPKLFTLVLEDACKRSDCKDRGLNISGERLHRLRFADDIILFAEKNKLTYRDVTRSEGRISENWTRDQLQ